MPDVSLQDAEEAIKRARKELQLAIVLSTAGMGTLEMLKKKRQIFARFAEAAAELVSNRQNADIKLQGEEITWFFAIVPVGRSMGLSGLSVEIPESVDIDSVSQDDYLMRFADFLVYAENQQAINKTQREIREPQDTLNHGTVMKNLRLGIDRELKMRRSYEMVRSIYVAEMVLDILRSSARMHVEIRRAALRMLYTLNPSFGRQPPGGDPVSTMRRRA